MDSMQASMMEALKYVFGATIVLDFCIVLYVLAVSKIWNTQVKTYIALFISLFLWEVSIWASYYVPASEHTGMIIDQISFAIGAIAAFYSIYFFWLIIKKKYISKLLIEGIAILSFLLAATIWIPNLFFQGRVYDSSYPYLYTIIPGPLLPVYYLIVGPVLLLICYLYIRGYKDAKNLEKIRLKYIGMGLLTNLAFCIITAIWVPLFIYIDTGNFNAMGDAATNMSIIFAAMSTSLFSIFSAYAISRYRFMDIKVVLKKSVVYGLTLVASCVVFGLVTFSLYHYTQSLIAVIVAGCLVFIGADWYKRRLKSLLDSIFFMDELDLSKRMSENAKKLNSTHELETYVLELVVGLRDIVKADVQRVFITEEQHNRYVAYYPTECKEYLSFDDEIVHVIAEKGKDADMILLAQELQECDDTASKQILKYMRKYDAEVMITIQNDDVLMAIVLVGKKKTQEVFLKNELNNITTFMQTSRGHLGIVLAWANTVEGLKITLREGEFESN